MGFPPDLFSHPADIVAPYVLESTLRRGPVALMITEVEAYLGEADPASHASRGPTPRCVTMFGPPLHLYVYASYGIHRAGNVVCCPEGVASGLLLRAGRVIDGYDVVRSRRGNRPEAVHADQPASAIPSKAQHTSTRPWIPHPAPSKNPTDRSAEPAAPKGRNCPMVPHGDGSHSGPVCIPDSGFDRNMTNTAPMPGPT